MIINHFKMRSNIISYNLAGMGCSAGVIAINLAKELLQVSQKRRGGWVKAIGTVNEEGVVGAGGFPVCVMPFI